MGKPAARSGAFDDPTVSGTVIAVGQDGTAYFTQLTFVTGAAPTFTTQSFPTRTLVALDADSGSPRLAYTGPQSTITVTYACNGTTVTQNWSPGIAFGNVTLGPDGTLYSEVPVGTTTGTNSCTGVDSNPHFYDINSSTQTLYLLQIPPGGSPSLTPIHTDTSVVGGFAGYSVIPDGQGGVLAPWSHGMFNGIPADNHVTRISSSGAQSDFQLSLHCPLKWSSAKTTPPSPRIA